MRKVDRSPSLMELTLSWGRQTTNRGTSKGRCVRRDVGNRAGWGGVWTLGQECANTTSSDDLCLGFLPFSQESGREGAGPGGCV